MTVTLILQNQASADTTATDAAASAEETSAGLAALQAETSESLARLSEDVEVLKDQDDIRAAIVGAAELSLDSAAEDITEGELNGGAAGTVRRTFQAFLRRSGGVSLGLGGAPTVTTAENVVDVDVLAPTVNRNVSFNKDGVMEIEIIFDTDAGATKTYAAGDDVSVTLSFNGMGAYDGIPDVTKTYNVIT